MRERFAFSDAAIPGALEKLRRDAGAAEAVILSTCNRVEIYAVMDSPEREAAARLRQFLIDYHQCAGAVGRRNLLPHRVPAAWNTSSRSPAAWIPWSWAKRKSWAS